jgi:hypothetical protein
MPSTCFSYEPDLPPGSGARDVAPPGLRRMPAGPCFSYPAEEPCRMPLPCFSYPGDAPRPALPGLRTMPNTACFRY